MAILPKIPYSDAELELFARLQLKTANGSALSIHEPDQTQIRDFVRVLKQLPPWQQVLTVEFRLPNLMGDEKALRTIHHKNTARDKDVLGLFTPRSDVPGVEPLTVSWGGTLENRRRTWDGGIAPDLTYFHETGHRMDMIAGSKPSDIRSRTTKNLRYHSSLPFWVNPVHAYVQEHAGAFYSGDGPRGGPLYPGARSLISHLSTPTADGTPFYAPKHHPAEAMAELMCSYTALYTKYSGHHRAIAQELNTAYPTLWKPMDRHVIAEVTSLAERLYTRREATCRSLVAAAASQAKLGREPFDAGEVAPMVRLVAIQHGMEPLDKMASTLRSARNHRRRDIPDAYVQPVGRTLDGMCTPNIRAVMDRG